MASSRNSLECGHSFAPIGFWKPRLLPTLAEKLQGTSWLDNWSAGQLLALCFPRSCQLWPPECPGSWAPLPPLLTQVRRQCPKDQAWRGLEAQSLTKDIDHELSKVLVSENIPGSILCILDTYRAWGWGWDSMSRMNKTIRPSSEAGKTLLQIM